MSKAYNVSFDDRDEDYCSNCNGCITIPSGIIIRCPECDQPIVLCGTCRDKSGCKDCLLTKWSAMIRRDPIKKLFEKVMADGDAIIPDSYMEA